MSLVLPEPICGTSAVLIQDGIKEALIKFQTRHSARDPPKRGREGKEIVDPSTPTAFHSVNHTLNEHQKHQQILLNSPVSPAYLPPVLTMSTLPIHLPWFITIHASGMTLLGLYLLFKAPPPGRPAGHTPQLGIASVAIGLAYLFTAYMPVEENQWLHASVPVRLLLGVLLGVRTLVGGGLTKAEKRSLLGLGLYDGLGAVVLGLWLGRFDGRLS